MTSEDYNGASDEIRVLIVDDEIFILQAWKKILSGHNCELKTLSDGTKVIPLIENWKPDVTVLDIRMPAVSGLDLLKEIRSLNLITEVIMMTAFATVETAVEAVKNGAYDYLTKPFSDIESAARTVIKAAHHKRLVQRNRELENMLDVRGSFEGLVGSGPKMRKIFELIEGVAYSSSTVLLQGQSGTGKELVARAIHHRSPRRSMPFVAVNCSALTDTLLESELFGHEKGSFTGAMQTKKGLFEGADGGTIFLDEIGQVPQPTQVKLLRVLQEGEVKRVGSSENRSVDVRVIAATNVDLAKAKNEGNFREDLFYRLNVIAIELPPLCDRAGDIPLLALHFLRKYNARSGKTIEGISPQVMELFESYLWPGNVRELENVIERAVVLGRGKDIELADMPDSMREPRPVRRGSHTSLVDLPYCKAKAIAIGEFDRRYLSELLMHTGGNVSQASRQAGMDRSNFRRVMKKYELDPVDFTSEKS
jgi:DNA-binding NtrC family response regulator